MARYSIVALVLGAAYSVYAQSTTTTANPTATPAPTGEASAALPSQAALPPEQEWCPSEIFCAGEILQTINIAAPYADSKTIVDKPTNGTSEETIASFEAFSADGIIYSEITTFLQQNFQGEGLELAPLSIPNFPENPAAFRDIPDPYVKGFTLEVHKIWDLLIRDTNESTICVGGRCESSLIPLNHTFVVPGGRFREQYYWDSKFILDGLLASELYDVAESTLQNFMDEIDQFGFIPNGGRIYYLNRSQPPVFIPMVLSYVNATGRTSILERAIPLMEAELDWWEENRTIDVSSPYTNETYRVSHYSVTNSAPRPESYREDYLAANGPDLSTPYTSEQKASLYAELASGAESGWDYSSRWIKDPYAAGASLENQTPILRLLNVRDTVAVDLNSILYRARMDLARLYEIRGQSAKRLVRRQEQERADFHRQVASSLKAGILDLFWDPVKLAFYDFNVTSNARNTQFTAAHFYPLWANIIPSELVASEGNAFGAFASLNLVLNRYNGTFPATFVETGLQWDFPNSWPPHIFFALEALANLPTNVTGGALPVDSSRNSWNLVPAGQLGIGQDKLPSQTLHGGQTYSGADLNFQNVTANEGWAKALSRQLANRYFTSVYCGWYASGGSIPNLLPRLPDQALNVTQSIGQNGHLFEKFSALDVDSAGRGGEYAVQAGFGWTNGVLLWIAKEYKGVLLQPVCPPIVEETQDAQSGAMTLVPMSTVLVSLVVVFLI